MLKKKVSAWFGSSPTTSLMECEPGVFVECLLGGCRGARPARGGGAGSLLSESEGPGRARSQGTGGGVLLLDEGRRFLA